MTNIKARLAAGLGTLALAGGGLGVMGAVTASATTARPSITVTCNACIHVQNDAEFRGALDAVHQGTAVNTPIVLWYERPSTTDPGADLLQVSAGVVTNHGGVNQSTLNWSQYKSDSVVRYKYDPYGNGGANTYIGLNGTASNPTVALRADNPNSIWQEFIRVPVDKNGFTLPNSAAPTYYVLIDVGSTTNPNDPLVVSDPQGANTGSLVQQDLEPADINQYGAYSTTQVWDTQN